MASVSDAVESTDWEELTNQYDESYDEVVTKTYVKGTDYAAGGSMTLEDVAGLSYEDPAWDELISQLTVEEMQALVADATYKTPNVESIDKGGTSDSDGPLGISNMFNPAMNSVAYPCTPILSGSFNTELAENFGKLVSDQAHNKGVTGWYAPLWIHTEQLTREETLNTILRMDGLARKWQRQLSAVQEIDK